ncbi:cell wall-associated NlpC family hydrolase [Streptomyces sp. 846.5]|nr:C40 family peptidase [Streptomyces sp. 846.5]TDT95626.1 cell wall-associated NlpC family hydrolase [Streptomyces sp. 846.5]
MATHRRPKQPSRAKVSILTAAAATAVALSAQASAQAAPMTTSDQAKSQVEADQAAASAATEQYDQAQTQEQALQRQTNVLQDEIARQQAAVNKELGQLGQMASAEYRNGAVDPTVKLLLASNPSEYLSQASTQSRVAGSQAAMLQQLQSQQKTLAEEKAQAAQELTAQQTLLQQMQTAKNTAQSKLNHAQSVLSSLSATARAAVQAAVAKSQGTSSSGGGYGSVNSTDNHMSVSQINLSGISAAARTAMEAAMSKVGVAPYSFGAAGPNAFDCSGLVMWAFAHAGISLPHSSYSDESVGTLVASSADLKVGDIVVLEHGNHVGLYAGNGMLLNAPEYGYNVSIQPMSYFGSIVAIRRF